MKQMFKHRVLLVLLLTLTMIISVPVKSSWADDLPLTGLTINEFKIIDHNQGDLEIDISYAMETDPNAFTNILCADQKDSSNKLIVNLTYNSATPFQEGDRLIIPTKIGGPQYPFSPLPLTDAAGNVLGTWEFGSSGFIINFGGDYINNNTITKLNATMETGWMANAIGNQPKTFNKGERIVKEGLIGNNPFTIAYEKKYVVADNVDSSNKSIGKSATSVTDSRVKWYYYIRNDFKYKTIDGKSEYFSTPHLLQNNGQYKPDSFTGNYIEDTIYDALEVSISNGHMSVSGINDDGKIISGSQGISLDFNDVLTEVDQAGRTRAQVKAALQNGEYCMYQNADGTTTVMIKYWDMNDSNGYTYNDVPVIAAAGGVGNYLKSKLPDIYGGVSDATIQNINQMFDGKIVQNISLVVTAKYDPVSVPVVKENTAQVTTDQTGTINKTAYARLTPPVGTADLPTDPLAIKLIKTDKNIGAGLSTEFSFALEASTDNGTTWDEVTLTDAMVEKGTLNADNTITPLAGGVLQVHRLTDGTKYRFVEKSHPSDYQDVAIDNDNPNDADHTTSANSETVDVTNLGQGHLILMYNEKTISEYTEEYYKEDPNGIVEYNSKMYTIVTADTLTKTGTIGGAVAPEDKDYPGFTPGDVTYQDGANNESTNSLTIPADGSLVIRHYFEALEATDPVKEVKDSDGVDVDTKPLWPGQEIVYTITYTNTTGLEKDITITDPLSEFVEFVSADNGGVENNGTVTWSRTVADGEVFKASVKVRVKDDVDGDVITNKAIVNDGTIDYETNETSNRTPGIPTDPTKEVFASDGITSIDGQEVQPGQELTYAITYTNTTGESKNITITDKLSEFVEFVSADNGGVENNGTITWTTNVANEETYKVGFKVKVKDDVDGDVIINKAIVNDVKDDFETNETRNPTPRALLDPTKEVFASDGITSIDGQEVQPGQELTYAITYVNTTGESKNITITDKLSEFVEFVSADNGGVENNETVTWTASVANGQIFKVTFKVKVKDDVDGDVIINKAIVNDVKNDFETNETSNPTPMKPLPTDPTKEVFATGSTTNIDGQEVQPDQELTYAITYVNTTGESKNITITDKLSEFVEFVSADNGGVESNGTITWTDTVADGEVYKVTFKVKVKESVDEDIITNKANANDGNNDYSTNETINTTPKKDKSTGTNGSDLPKTGTSTGMTPLYAMLFILSGIALAVFSRKRKLQ